MALPLRQLPGTSALLENISSRGFLIEFAHNGSLSERRDLCVCTQKAHAIWWCEMVKEATVETSSGTPAEGTSCRGLLYLSTAFSKNSSNKQPLCVGFSRRVNVVYKGEISRKEVAEHGQALRNFKYACMGHSLYRNAQLADRLASGSIRESDLPSCEGLVMLEVRDAAKQGQVNQNNHRSNEGARAMPRPPTQIRPAKGVTPEDFSTKFIRSAGLVAAALKQNVYRIGNHVKTMVEDIFHPGGSGSK